MTAADKVPEAGRVSDYEPFVIYIPCLTCGQTRKLTGGVEEAHEHVVHASRQEAMGYAWWQGFDRGERCEGEPIGVDMDDAWDEKPS